MSPIESAACGPEVLNSSKIRLPPNRKLRCSGCQHRQKQRRITTAFGV